MIAAANPLHMPFRRKKAIVDLGERNMGQDSRQSRRLLRCGLHPQTAACFEGGVVDPESIELLIEPTGLAEITSLAEFATDYFRAERVADLKHFVWLRVPFSVLEERLAREGDLDVNAELYLREMGIARIWPNLMLEPQGWDERQPQRHELQNACLSMSADPQLNDGEGIVWAVVDTDVRDTHQVLQGAPIDRWVTQEGGVITCFNGYPCPGPASCGHGTHIAGLIRLLAPKVKLVSVALGVQVVGEIERPYKLLSTGHLESALEWIAEQDDVHGVNISLGIPPGRQDPVVGRGPGCPGVQDCLAKGKLVVIAAGNYGRDTSHFRETSITDPANARGALVVGAAADDPLVDGIWSWSSHGPTADGRLKPDLVAPGVELPSCSDMNDIDLVSMSGTSQAAALVSGAVAALMSSCEHRMPPEVIVKIIKETATDLERDMTYQGTGLLNLSNARSMINQMESLFT